MFHWSAHPRLRTILALSLLGTGSCISATALGQKPDEGKEYTQGSQTKDLTTSDGVYLSARYWSPAKADRNTPVIILLHMRGEPHSQRDWYPFAAALKEAGFAVVTFDFRGHADSRTVDRKLYKSPREANESEKASRTKQRRSYADSQSTRRRPEAEKGDKIQQASEFVSGRDIRFLTEDLNTVMGFLVEQNNAEKINLHRLGIVAAGDMSCNVVIQWLAEAEPRSESGEYDVNALVLISPSWGYKGLALPAASMLGEGDGTLPILMAFGDKSVHRADAEKLARTYKLFPLDLGAAEGSEKKEKKSTASARTDFYRKNSGWFTVPSKLDGTDLFRPPLAKIDEHVTGFLAARLKSDRAIAWERRTSSGAAEGFGTRRQPRS